MYKHKSYINFRMLMRVIGMLMVIESGFMLIPLITSLLTGDGNALNFLISAAITAGAGSALVSMKPRSRDMGKREAFLMTALTWVILSMFGMLPFMFTGTHMSVTDAFFETMSGFTTTGSSVLDTLDNVPKSILIWRCVLQWIGGLGIILFTLAIIPMLNYQGGMQLFNAEVTGITHDKLRPRVSNTAKGLWGVYISLTILLIILLSFSEMSFFEAVCYGLSTMSTGGFAISDSSLTTWNSDYIKTIMSIFMFLGGVNFALIYNLVLGKKKNPWHNDAFRWYVYIIGIAYLLFCVNVLIEGIVKDWSDLTIDPLFQSISILSSTGVTEPDFADWGALSSLVVIVMMFIGACAGSTSGGAKIDRFIILFKFLKNEFYKMMHPNVVTTVTINGKGTTTAIVNKTMAFLMVYGLVIIVGGMALCLLGMPLHDGFYCALSAISNTGLGTETTGVAGNFSLVPDMAKWVLSFIMLAGRLELFTVLLIFTPTFWKS